jgi:hypothetical protein
LLENSTVSTGSMTLRSGPLIKKGNPSPAADVARCGSAAAKSVLGPRPGKSPSGSASGNGAASPAARRTAGKSPIDVAQTSTDKPAMDETSVRKMTQVTTAYMYSRSSPIGAVGTLQTIIVA